MQLGQRFVNELLLEVEQHFRVLFSLLLNIILHLLLDHEFALREHFPHVLLLLFPQLLQQVVHDLVLALQEAIVAQIQADLFLFRGFYLRFGFEPCGGDVASAAQRRLYS